MIYLDNAATTAFKPPEVKSCINQYLSDGCFSFNRSNYSQSVQLSNQIYDTRVKVAAFVNCKNSLNVVFSQNCTTALNNAILGRIKEGGHVITTVCEHNSVLRPLFEAYNKKIIELTVIKCDENGFISTDTIKKHLRPTTCLVVVNHVSNVTGYTQNLEEIGKFLAPYDLDFVVDAAQSIGYIPIDMQKCNIDLLAFPAHKGLHSVTGCGVLCFNDNCVPRPIIFGGTGVDSGSLLQPTYSPEGLESGTQNAMAILALSAAISWSIETQKNRLPKIQKLQSLLQQALSQMEGVRVYSVPNGSGIVSFEILDVDSGSTGDYLSEKGFALRTGLHCAPLIHKHLGTFERGLVRASVSAENSEEECYKFIKSVGTLVKNV